MKANHRMDISISDPLSDHETARHPSGGDTSQQWDTAGPSTEWRLSDLELGRSLGKGHFGAVYLARVKRADGFLLALKCLQKKDIEQNGSETQVRREIEVMKHLRHPNIIRLYGWFHDDTRVFMMMEYAVEGEVYKHLARQGRFSEKRSSRYVGQVASGLAYLHEHSVIHRDIKPENLLLSKEGEIKIGDFGWSVYSPEERQRTIAGTLSYVSPEMVLGQPYGLAVDAWALGVLAYEFLCGEEPFGSEAEQGSRNVQSRICRVDVRYPSHVSSEATSFMSQLLRYDPASRMSLAQVVHDPWIARYRKNTANQDAEL